MTKLNLVSFCLRIPNPLKQRVEDFASREYKSITQVILDAIRDYLERNDG